MKQYQWVARVTEYGAKFSKTHLSRDGKKTLCNQEIIHGSLLPVPDESDLCKNCQIINGEAKPAAPRKRRKTKGGKSDVVIGERFTEAITDDCPFEWDPEKPTCRIYDPAYYQERVETKKSDPKKNDDKFYFGKHKGLPISEVPAEYLDWVIGTFGDKPRDAKIKDRCREELERRNG